MIKTPNGMDFTVPGWNLDIIQRGLLEKALVLERGFGVMLSGRLIGQDGFTDKPMKTNRSRDGDGAPGLRLRLRRLGRKSSGAQLRRDQRR
jgi:hypothetical protein